MSYIPSRGKFINGKIADADDITTEFNLISSAITKVINDVTDGNTETLRLAKAYTDSQITTVGTDGGTF